MAEAQSFEDLLEKVRTGDAEAAEKLVRTYEPAIRRAIRFRMSDTRLGAAFDSMDVCQSVLGSFFVRAATGQYDLEKPEQLMGLLVSMARKKLAMKVRHERAAMRDNRKRVSGDPVEHNLAGSASTPSGMFQAKEMLGEVQARLSPEEQELVKLRSDGMEWRDIADQMGGSPEALRKKLARAVDRVASELGIDEVD